MRSEEHLGSIIEKYEAAIFSLEQEYAQQLDQLIKEMREKHPNLPVLTLEDSYCEAVDLRREDPTWNIKKHELLRNIASSIRFWLANPDELES